MMKQRFTRLALALATVAASASASAALFQTESLGNTTPGFADGSTPGVPAVGAAIAGQPAPFDQGYGSDVLVSEGSFSQSWTHSFAAIADTILSATLTIGIFDHDSAASGNQLANFAIDGVSFTTALDTLFEAGGGSTDGEYNEYTVSLAPSDFANIADGSVTIDLALAGPGLVTSIIDSTGAVVAPFLEEVATNGANLIFSSLVIETEAAPPPPPPGVPEPGSLALLGLGMAALAARRHRRGDLGAPR